MIPFYGVKRNLSIYINELNNKNGNKYVIKLQINEIPNIFCLAILDNLIIFDSMYGPNEDIVLKENIYSINLIFFYLYSNDDYYYHYFSTSEEGKK